MKQIPSGIDDFDEIIQEDYYYIDKTRFIISIENRSHFILFVRPRRMGKSLFVNMLMSYYDINKKEKFDKLFGNLWIGKNKTKYANTFFVLKFDFSKVKGLGEQLVDNFNAYCFLKLEDFFDRYREYFSPHEIERVLSLKDLGLAITRLTDIAKIKGIQVYLFLDEYDNFSNTILATRGVRAHEEITHGEGFYRDFFKSCKGAFQRILMTGVAPITYDDLTSGFNIADVISLKPRFDKMIGVTETELREMIEYYRSQDQISQDTDEIVAEMKPWYDNFCFAEECYDIEPPLYNTYSVMRYMNSLIQDGTAPKPLIDRNARIDNTKLNFLVMAEDLDNRKERVEIIRQICTKTYTTGTVKDQFSASSCGDEDNFKSMLYYYGTLTFGGYDENGYTKLIVPNRNMGELYLQYMRQIAESEGKYTSEDRRLLDENIGEAALHHNWQPMINQIGEMYFKNSSVRNTIKREPDIQGLMRGFICLNDHFAIWPELELGKGFCDVLLVPRASNNCQTKYSYLIEIKHMKTEETDVEKYISQACDQLERYVSEYRLTESYLLRGTPLTLLYVVFQGTELKVAGVYE